MKGYVRMTSGRGTGRASGTGIRGLLHAAVTAAAALALAVAVAAGPLATPAAADPPLTVAEAKVQVQQLETEAEAIDQQALDVRIKLVAGTKALAAQRKDVRTQTAKVAQIRRQVGQVALAQFQNRNLDTTAKLFLTQDTDGFLNRMATVEKVSENQNSVLQDFQARQAHLADLERSARVDVATLQASDQELTRLRTASAAKIAQSRAVLARLTQQERERIAAEERAAEQAAQRAAAEAAARATEESSASDSSRSESSESESESESSEPSGGEGNSDSSGFTSAPQSRDGESSKMATARSSGKGAVAIAYARKQLGKPYVWAAEGPGSFDCSGLTSSAWRAAGVSIPRTSAVQSKGAGRPVAKADLRPGDLVFFFSPVSHVALYAGDGIILHAPRPGKSVTYTTMSAMPYAGARRPG